MLKTLKWTCLLASLTFVIACKEEPKPATTPKPSGGAKAPEVKLDRAQVTAVFQPLPEVAESKDNPITEEKVALGRMLYYEKRISKNHDLSCNSCHMLDNYGVDGEPTSPGHKGVRGDRNSPTVYNAAIHIAQFWDGRSPNVEDQAKGPVLNPVEMAMPDEAYVLKVLNSIPGYVDAFKKAFPNDASPVTYDNFGKAVGAFERKLMTPAPFDDYLNGDDAALSNEEKAGLKKFIETGCIQCHVGPGVGGNTYNKLGLLKPWPDLKDEGRAKVTGNETEKYFFKVPSLRNIEKTGPYLHDGSIKDLPTLVKMMAEHQLGKSLTDEEVASIVTFLGSLTGEIPEDYIKQPKLPESGPDTPKPDPS